LKLKSAFQSTSVFGAFLAMQKADEKILAKDSE